jgi:hypothetical protein
LAANYALTRRNSPGRIDQLSAIRAQMVFAVIVLGVCLLAALPLALVLRANPDVQQRR